MVALAPDFLVPMIGRALLGIAVLMRLLPVALLPLVLAITKAART